MTADIEFLHLNGKEALAIAMKKLEEKEWSLEEYKFYLREWTRHNTKVQDQLRIF